MPTENAVLAIAEPVTKETEQDPGELKKYRAPWKGSVVLVCKKCQKKLRHGGNKKLAKLGKELKKRSKAQEEGPRLHVIEVSCMKMCPKGGVTVCTQQHLATGQCSIVYSKADIAALVGSVHPPVNDERV